MRCTPISAPWLARRSSEARWGSRPAPSCGGSPRSSLPDRRAEAGGRRRRLFILATLAGGFGPPVPLLLLSPRPGVLPPPARDRLRPPRGAPRSRAGSARRRRPGRGGFRRAARLGDRAHLPPPAPPPHAAVPDRRRASGSTARRAPLDAPPRRALALPAQSQRGARVPLRAQGPDGRPGGVDHPRLGAHHHDSLERLPLRALPDRTRAGGDRLRRRHPLLARVPRARRARRHGGLDDRRVREPFGSARARRRGGAHLSPRVLRDPVAGERRALPWCDAAGRARRRRLGAPDLLARLTDFDPADTGLGP